MVVSQLSEELLNPRTAAERRQTGLQQAEGKEDQAQAQECQKEIADATFDEEIA